MKIAFLIDNAYGIGGTIRTTANLSGALIDRGHQVEVVSLRRTTARPGIAFKRGVRLSALIDLMPDSPGYDGDDPLFHQPSERYAEGTDHFERGIATRLGDVRIKQWLQNTDAEAVIATRPKINDYLSAYGTDQYLRIGQEHLTRLQHRAYNRERQDAAIPGLDAFVTCSSTDAEHYRKDLAEAVAGGTVITSIPNSVPAPDVSPSDGNSRLIVAAGRLIGVKRYDRLVRAFALASAAHPDWRLRLYGRGPARGALRELIDSLGMADRISLMGPASPLEAEWPKGAFAAVSSDAEAFSMTMLEAISCGLPVVTTDCPYAASEIFRGQDAGLLVPIRPAGEGGENRTVREYAATLSRLMGDADLRARLAAGALRRSQDFLPERIVVQYEQLLDDLRDRLDKRRTPPPTHTDTALPRAGGPVHTLSPPLRRPLRSRLPSWVRWALRPAWRMLHGKPPIAPAGKLKSPQARVRVTADGSLAVRMRAGALPARGADLVFTPRRGTAAEPVRVPLPSRARARARAADGWYTALLDHASRRLEAGRWDVWLVSRRDGQRVRLRAVLVETARLLSMPAPPTDSDGAIAPWVPYTDGKGKLVVRSWRRHTHAEVLTLDSGPEVLTITARVYGAAEDTKWRLSAVARTDPDRSFELPARNNGEAQVTADVPSNLPAELSAQKTRAEETWDLWLTPRDDGPPVRLARVLDDLAERKTSDVSPWQPVGHGLARIRPYFTLNNALALDLRPADVPEALPDSLHTTPSKGDRHARSGRR